MGKFEVDERGLAKILARRGKEFLVYELWQNAADENTPEIRITLERIEGRPAARIVVEDDAPNGFADLAHAYTLFAESVKKSDPTRAGRFNLGEKLVIAICETASIVTTTGGVRFDSEGRHALRQKRDAGSIFEGVFRCTRDELEEIIDAAERLIPRPGTRTVINGRALPERDVVGSFEESLPTEIADADGNLVRSARKTKVDVLDPLPGETAMLYELGIPVVPTGDRWHVNVQQKVPLNMDRDNVPPSYLKKIRVLVLNQLHYRISTEDANEPWVRQASSDSDCSPDAIRTVLDKRFGEKRVAYDPSNPEANSLATSQGYTVVSGGMLSGQEWQNAKTAGAILPAGKVTPSPKPYSENPNAKPEDLMPEDQWTDGMSSMADYSRLLARKLLNIDITVRMTRAGIGFGACYGAQELTFNVQVLGRNWFTLPFGAKHDELLIHEFGHQYSSDHLSAEYHNALCMLGAKLAGLAFEEPEVLKPFRSSKRE